MRVFVPHGRVAVPMGMWFFNFIFMGMIVMGVMHMAMVMLQFTVDVLMLVAFGQMKPQTNRHQCTCQYQLRRHGLSQQHNSENRTNERRQ